MISKATLGRIPDYLRYLEGVEETVSTISATTLAKKMSLGEVQVRKDLALVCGKGKPKIGYNVKDLISSMRSVLADGPRKEAVIVGAGKLGRALLGFAGFSEYGLSVTKAFDTDESKCGGNVLPMSEFRSYCILNNVEMGIITVSPETAQETADEMVKCGIRAIWCFSSQNVKVPEGVVVRYENLALSLAHLQKKIG